MGIKRSTTFQDAITPVCNSCGIYLCWDISDSDYRERPDFWESWLCRPCRVEMQLLPPDKADFPPLP